MASLDFDKFLNQLSRMLHLSRSQRRQIREELEDHIQSQLADLKAAGLCDEDAISRVLDEFGDAAELAGRFSRIGQKRRWIMRSAIAASLVAATTLVTSFLLPPQRGNPLAPRTTSAHNAQSPPPAAGAATPSVIVDRPNPLDEQVRRALDQTLPEVNFEEATLEETLRFFRDKAGVNIVADWRLIEEAGIDRELTVTMRLKDIRLSRAMALVLRLSSEPELDYRVQDGLVLVSVRERFALETEVRLYDCTALFDRAAPRWLTYEVQQAIARWWTGSTGNPGDPSRHPNKSRNQNVQQAVMKHLVEVLMQWRSNELREVIQNTVAPDTWKEQGGNVASITVFGDILAIVQTTDNHEAIGRLLDKLAQVRHDAVARASADQRRFQSE